MSFRIVSFTAALAAMTLLASPVSAAFHLWNIREIYSNSSGSLQFVELFTTSNSQEFVGGQQIQVHNIGNTITNTFTIPTNSPAPTANHALLFGTAGLQAAGGPAPDYIIPNNFLFSAGGSITFFGTNSGSYTALPTDGLMSRTWATGTNAINTPQNFAGQTSTIVPEPGLLAAASGIVGLACLRRRRLP